LIGTVAIAEQELFDISFAEYGMGDIVAGLADERFEQCSIVVRELCYRAVLDRRQRALLIRTVSAVLAAASRAALL